MKQGQLGRAAEKAVSNKLYRLMTQWIPTTQTKLPEAASILLILMIQAYSKGPVQGGEILQHQPWKSCSSYQSDAGKLHDDGSGRQRTKVWKFEH
jgi:hypothetical protein